MHTPSPSVESVEKRQLNRAQSVHTERASTASTNDETRDPVQLARLKKSRPQTESVDAVLFHAMKHKQRVEIEQSNGVENECRTGVPVTLTETTVVLRDEQGRESAIQLSTVSSVVPV